MAGDTVLIEECSENIDPGLDSVLSKAFYPDEGVMKLNFGDKPLIYDTNFRLLLTTKLHNPHFLPETCIKLTVINFTVTFDGLEDQLLVDVINNREPEIEKRRDKLVVEIATSKNQLARLQEQILFELAESNAETILDNVKLIETLEICKSESTNVAASLEEAVQVEETINTTRNRYRKVAERGSILYFSIVEMSQVDPMYQNSLSYVKKLFNEAILQTRKVVIDESAPAMQQEAVHQ
jgi:dynein heavy chain